MFGKRSKTISLEDYNIRAQERYARLRPDELGFFGRVRGTDLFEWSELLTALRVIERELIELKEIGN